MAILTVARKPSFILLLLLLALSNLVFAQGTPPAPTGVGAINQHNKDIQDALGQQDANNQKMVEQDKTPLVFKAHVIHVLVPIIVTDKKNQFVPGLTKNDFVIYENGKEQPVLSVDEMSTDTSHVERVKSIDMTSLIPDANGGNGPVTAYTNELKGAQSQKRILIVLMDRVNTKFLDQTLAMNAILKYLARATTNNSLIELINMNSKGLQVIYDFTSDPKLLIAALQKKTGERGLMQNVDQTAIDTAPSSSQVQSILNNSDNVSLSNDLLDSMFANSELQYANFQQQNAVNITMECFAHIADVFRGVPGRKSMIWLTDSFGTEITDPNSPFPSFVDRGGFESAFTKLSDSNIAVYPVDVRGLATFTVPNLAASASNLSDSQQFAAFMRTQSARNIDSIATMNAIAEMTGGKAYYNSNDFAGMITQAQQDGQNYYMLSYAIDKNNTKPGFRKIKVRSTRDGVSVRSRAGFFATKTTNDPQITRKRDVNDALDSPVDFTGFPVRATLGAIKDDENGKRKVAYKLVVPASTITIDADNKNSISMDFAYNVVDHQGNSVDKKGGSNNINLDARGIKMLTEIGMLYENSFIVPPGDYTVHFVIRDNLSGRTGSVSVPVTVPKGNEATNK